jgi:hypothetical protein
VDLLLQAHALATAALAGLVWVVQLIVYPAFRTVGPTPAWPEHHRAHSTAMTRLVALPWLVQGGTLAALLLRDPSPLLLLTGALAATAVAGTVLVSVPLHLRLGQAYDDATAVRLIRTNWLRTAAWTAGAVCAAVLAGS